MKLKSLLLWAGGLGGLYYLYKQYINAVELGKSIIISPNNINLNTTHITAPVLEVSVQITNPTPNSVIINKIFAKVLFQGSLIGTINNNESIKIPGTATTTMTINVNINTIEVITTLLNTNFNKPVDIIIDGYYVANEIQLPLLLNFSTNKI